MASSSSSSSNLAHIPAGKAPPGISQHDHDSSYSGAALTAVLGVLTFIALAFYVLRIQAKIKRLRWDDLTCTLGMIGTIVDVVCVGVASINGPLGQHIWNISLAEYYSDNFVVTGFVLQTTGSLTLGLIKLTIFLFYLDIFWPLTWCRWTVYIAGSLSSAFYLSVTIVQFYFMIPRPGETIGKHFGSKLAHRVTALSIPTSSVGLAIDLLLLFVPLCAVFQLNMAKKKKIRLILTFSVGIMAVLGSVLSLAFKAQTYGNPDLTYHLILVNFFIAVEMTLGICIACVPFVYRVSSQHAPKIIEIASSVSSSLHSLIRHSSVEKL